MDDCRPSSARKKARPVHTHQDLIGNLPIDCILNIFRFLPSSRDRCCCAAVSKQWLILQASIQISQLGESPPTNDDSNSRQVSRCLEEKHTNNIRIAAMTVGIRSQGKILSELCIKGGVGLPFRGITDIGLGIIARACSNLKSFSLWDCKRITSKGIIFIAKACQSLEKLDFLNLPMVDDAGLISIAENSTNLMCLNIESLPLIGDESIKAFAKGSSPLTMLSLVKCPLVSDQGIITIISNSPSLAQLKIISMNIAGGGVLEAICRHGASLSSLSLAWVTQAGFLVPEVVHQKLRFLSLKSCACLSDASFKAIGQSLVGLKEVIIQNCETLTDVGLNEVTKSPSSLESLKLVGCNNVTRKGLSQVFLNCRSLKALSLEKCQGLGIDEDDLIQEKNLISIYPFLHSLIIKKCHGIGDNFLSWIGNACANVKHLSLIGLRSVTDIGVIALLQRGPKKSLITNLDLSECFQITDTSVVALTSVFGETLERLILCGCENISDFSLKMISKHCPYLVELQLSNCGISDYGVLCLATSSQWDLEVLSLDGCTMITDRSLQYIQMMCGVLMGLNLKCCSGLSKEGVDSLQATLWWCDLIH